MLHCVPRRVPALWRCAVRRAMWCMRLQLGGAEGRDVEVA